MYLRQMNWGMYNLSVSKFMLGFVSIFGLVLVACLVFGSVVMFAIIQSWLADPHREEYNREWFRRFDEQMRERYENPELRWRYLAMSNHWAHQDGAPAPDHTEPPRSA